MKLIKFIFVITIMFVIVFGITNSYLVSQYITTLKYEQISSANKNLESYIKEYAKQNNILPEEPRVDKVWKLIPGYNGLIVNEQDTLSMALKQKVKTNEDILFIWEEIEPKNSLEDIKSYPIYRGNPNKQSVSLMFNVAWGTEYLDQILKILEAEQIKATFFLDGTWLTKNQDMAKRIANEGHEIGNHAYSHQQMSKLTEERIREEIIKTEELIYSTTYQHSKYFAPPSGDYDQRVVKIADELNLSTVLWTLDTLDWQNPSPEEINERIVPKIDNGYLILMHPTKSTVEALPELIKEIKEKELNITTVNETFSTKRILQVEPLDNF